MELQKRFRSETQNVLSEKIDQIAFSADMMIREYKCLAKLSHIRTTHVSDECEKRIAETLKNK